MFKRLISSIVCICFICSTMHVSYARVETQPASPAGGDLASLRLPEPGTMVGPSTPLSPLTIKGLVINPKKPLEFQFIVDTGTRTPGDIESESTKLIKYFLAGLTIPEGDLWVNLSPYEKERIAPGALGKTELGRDLLAQDYILKQLTASLIYPERDLGKEFWARIYKQAQEKYGATNVPVNTFNKVWIVPDEAQVFENGGAVYVTKSTLKVMLDEDYMARQKHHVSTDSNQITSQIIRQIVIPEITKEINTGKNFAPLRQIYSSLILAKWYKETMQNGLLDTLYTNKSKTSGINLSDPSIKQKIYERYLQAYKKGVFNYIKDDVTPIGQKSPRKYFSGGTIMKVPLTTDGAMSAITSDGAMLKIQVKLDSAMTVDQGKVSSQTKVSQNELADRTIDAAMGTYDDNQVINLDWNEPSINMLTAVAQHFISTMPTIAKRLINVSSFREILDEAREEWQKYEYYLGEGEKMLFEKQIREVLAIPWEDRLKIFSFLMFGEILSEDQLVERLDRILFSGNIDSQEYMEVVCFLHNAGFFMEVFQSSLGISDVVNNLSDEVRRKLIEKFNLDPSPRRPVIFKDLVEQGLKDDPSVVILSYVRPSMRYDPSWKTKEMVSKFMSRALDIILGKVDLAMLNIAGAEEKNGGADETSAAIIRKKGGVDFNQINVNRVGKTIQMDFDPAQLNQLLEGGFEGFTTVIINIAPIQSLLPLLGVALRREDEVLAKV